jgi:hypothetical protein
VNHGELGAGFARNRSSKLSHNDGVVIHEGTHVAETLMAEK